MSNGAASDPDVSEVAQETVTPGESRHWRVITASVTGSSHVRSGLPCQDSFHIVSDESSGVLIATIADGAGSAELSAIGSNVAARSATQAASELIDSHTDTLDEAVLEEILRKTIASARDALELEVHRQGRELRNFATTLIMAICTHDLTGTAQIGDGAVVTARRGDGDGEFVYALFSPPQRGEYANQTNFITSGSWQDALDVRTLPEGLGYMVMFTDGIQSLALDSAASYAPHGPFFDPLLRWIGQQGDLKGADETLKTFLSSPRVAERTDDDLTLVLAVRHKDKRPREDEIE